MRLLVSTPFFLLAVSLIACAPEEVGEELDSRDDDLVVGDGLDDGDDDGKTDMKLTVAATNASGAACPTDARLSQRFHGKHDGIDLANVKGTPIFAVLGGKVVASGPASGYGQWIRIEHDDGSLTEYGHMSSRLVKQGERVRAGQRIALMGAEGRATGSHLHLRTYKSAKKIGAGAGMNPAEYLRARGISVPCKPGVASKVAGAEGAGDPSSKTVEVWRETQIRSSARTSASVVGELEAGDSVSGACFTIGESVSDAGYTNDRWVKISDGGVTGYVSGIYLKGDETGGVTARCR